MIRHVIVNVIVSVSVNVSVYVDVSVNDTVAVIRPVDGLQQDSGCSAGRAQRVGQRRSRGPTAGDPAGALLHG